MPGILNDTSPHKPCVSKLAAAQWVECQLRLLSTYQQIRVNLDQVEREIGRARKRMDRWRHSYEAATTRLRLSLSPFSGSGGVPATPDKDLSACVTPALSRVPSQSLISGMVIVDQAAQNAVLQVVSTDPPNLSGLPTS